MSAHKDVNGRENVHCTTHLDGHFAPGMVFGAIGARPDFQPIKPAPSAQSANTATAMSVKDASEAKIRCLICQVQKGKSVHAVAEDRPRRDKQAIALFGYRSATDVPASVDGQS